jgi:hypothetical protein
MFDWPVRRRFRRRGMPVIPRNAYNRLNFESSEKAFSWYCERLNMKISKPEHEVPAVVVRINRTSV